MTRKAVTRDDLCEAVQHVIGLSRLEARTAVNLVLDEIVATLETGETVKLSSFGSFVVRKKGERLGRKNRRLSQPVAFWCLSLRPSSSSR